MAYSAYVISEASRNAILDRFPPKFGDVVCHHVTERFGLPAGERRLPPPAEILVVGYASDASLEALVVSVNGETKRPDGFVYHITLSLDRALGRKPADANRMIAAAGWSAVAPLRIEASPHIC
jgi:hypothetical protein